MVHISSLLAITVDINYTGTLYILHEAKQQPSVDLIPWRSTFGGSFYWHGVSLTLAWISNYIYYKEGYKITNTFPNFNIANIDVWEWMNNRTPYFTGDVNLYTRWYQN